MRPHAAVTPRATQRPSGRIVQGGIACPAVEMLGHTHELCGTLFCAAHPLDVAVDLEGALWTAAGATMQSVHVLRDEEKALSEKAFELRQGPMRGVRLRGPTDAAPVQVPAPHVVRVSLEEFSRGDLLRTILA